MLAKNADPFEKVTIAASPATKPAAIKVLNAALSERPDGIVVLRGTIANECLALLRADDYQREYLNGARKGKLAKGIAAGAVLPDIELGMRGGRYTQSGNTVLLHDPVYVIDGWQRVSNMREFFEAHPDKPLSQIGASIQFDTDKEMEKSRFAVLNQDRVPVSPNVLLRNLRDKHPSILALYGLTHSDKDFPLYGKVAWNQRMARGELVSAATVVRATRILHRHLTMHYGKGGTGEGRVANAPAAMDRVAEKIGLRAYRANIKEFFDVVEECWGITHIEYAQTCTHLRGNFLIALGLLFSQHPSFWKDDERSILSIPTATRRKLASFPIMDNEVRRLASAGGMALRLLLQLIVDHMNYKLSAKNRLKL